MSIRITLPDGSERDYDGGVTGHDVASDIGPRLAKAAVAVTVGSGIEKRVGVEAIILFPCVTGGVDDCSSSAVNAMQNDSILSYDIQNMKT